jgi:hypothetical protein
VFLESARAAKLVLQLFDDGFLPFELLQKICDSALSFGQLCCVLLQWGLLTRPSTFRVCRAIPKLATRNPRCFRVFGTVVLGAAVAVATGMRVQISSALQTALPTGDKIKCAVFLPFMVCAAFPQFFAVRYLAANIFIEPLDRRRPLL